ncbi:MAG: HIT family protein [Thiobacillaceae bacterium]
MIDGYVNGLSIAFFSALPSLHAGDWSATSADERIALFARVDAAKVRLDREFHADGRNLGINVGEAAGETLFHVHLHMIPRYQGDVPDPRGGMRGVIPSKQSYSKETTWQAVF